MFNKRTSTQRGVYSTITTELPQGIRAETVLFPTENSGEPEQLISVRVFNVDAMHDEAVALHNKGVRKPHGLNTTKALEVFNEKYQEGLSYAEALDAVLQWASEGGK